jgi:hypothetical protein
VVKFQPAWHDTVGISARTEGVAWIVPCSRMTCIAASGERTPGWHDSIIAKLVGTQLLGQSETCRTVVDDCSHYS